MNDLETPLGEEFIEEWKNPRSKESTYYCTLCGCQFDSKLVVLHAKGFGHKMQYKAYKDRESTEDRLVSAKNLILQQSESEYHSVIEMVETCEKALKQVSDIVDSKRNANDAKQKGKTDKKASGDSELPRTLMGVMRSGLLATGLLMAGEVTVHLVLLSAEKPSEALLQQVSNSLPDQLAAVSKSKYEVASSPAEACLYVTSLTEPRPSCKISLTSAMMRTHPFHYFNEIAPPDPDDVLPREICEEALRGLRRARWFEAKAFSLPYCNIVLRIMRDLCERVPTWSPISLWMLQLLVQKCLSSFDMSNSSPSDAVRLIFESVASGMLLPDSPGLYDTCEREPTDLCAQIPVQDREHITASAQHALRLISFGQMYKILGMPESALEAAEQESAGNKRKRSEDNDNDEGADGKKGRSDASDG